MASKRFLFHNFNHPYISQKHFDSSLNIDGPAVWNPLVGFMLSHYMHPSETQTQNTIILHSISSIAYFSISIFDGAKHILSMRP